MKLYIGVTKDDELVFFDWDKKRNEEQKTFSMCGGTYREPITEEQGEDKAREVLSSSDYWSDIGLLDTANNFLLNYIDFNAAAEEYLNVDGWENVNGEYTHFGEYEDEEIYLDYASAGQHQEKREDIKELWISEADFKRINEFWDNEHLKKLDRRTFNHTNEIFEHYRKQGLQDKEKVLSKYLKSIKWRPSNND